MYDRLPPKRGIYIIYAPTEETPGDYILQSAFWMPETKFWGHMPVAWVDSVTHWMPLPDPPGIISPEILTRTIDMMKKDGCKPIPGSTSSGESA